MKKINQDLLSNITVLYVEDEEIIREEVSYFFMKYIKNFYLAKNGLEGIELFNKIKPDILITDIRMPKLNGLDMIEQIDTSNTSVIITTAYSDIEYFLKAIDLNTSKYIIKPIDLAELANNIQECIIESNLKDKLYEKDNLLKIVDENVLISITDKNGTIIDVSHAFCDFIEYSKDEFIGQTHKILKHEDTPDIFYENMWKEITAGNVYNTEIKNRKKSGEIYWANLTITPVYKDGKIVNYTAIRQDVTNKKKLEQLIIEDSLTKLYNRRYFNKIIEKELRRVKRDDSTLSLLCIDVDYFKKYNDTYGHPVGDEALIAIAKALKEITLRSTDYVFRMGGEEFCVLFSGLDIKKSLSYANEIVKKIESLEIEHKSSKISKYLTISAGLTTFSSEFLTDSSTLYKYADKALYSAKKNGRNNVVLCEKSK